MLFQLGVSPCPDLESDLDGSTPILLTGVTPGDNPLGITPCPNLVWGIPFLTLDGVPPVLTWDGVHQLDGVHHIRYNGVPPIGKVGGTPLFGRMGSPLSAGLGTPSRNVNRQTSVKTVPSLILRMRAVII